jgi:polyhydroxyalkanoate synthase
MTAKDNTENALQTPDAVALGKAILNAYEQAQSLFEEYATKYSSPETYKEKMALNLDPMNVRNAYIDFLKEIASDPQAMIKRQTDFMQDWFAVWQSSVAKFMKQDASPFTTKMPIKADKRFRAPEWEEEAIFAFMKNSYLLVSEYVDSSIRSSKDLSTKEKDKLSFYTRVFTDALSPTNFAMTNPTVLQETMKTGGENLINGFTNMLGDLKRGKGSLKISMTQYDKFKLGENIAVTPGRVVFQNKMMQLIQYEPKTDKVFKTPMLIVPPWINKYYILDLRPGNSYVEWLVEQGHTVFIMSWVNPDAKMAETTFSDYVQEGVITAIDKVKEITKEDKINATSYCIGGTLLATTLAYLAETRKESPVASATFLTTMLDFEKAGEILLFLDEKQIATIDKQMEKTGYLDGAGLKKAFTMLKANDLIWSFVINNYLMGKEPFPFDLLFWNDDPTNMPKAMHSFYLHNMYSRNKLIEPGGISIEGVDIDLSKIKVPCHFVSTKEDHIAPWVATYSSARKLGGDVTFTLSGSGHIAGIINPPAKKKYGFSTSPKLVKSSDEWLKNATEHEGSWWPHWQKWVATYAGDKVTARKVAKGIEAAPGSYVTAAKASE